MWVSERLKGKGMDTSWRFEGMVLPGRIVRMYGRIYYVVDESNLKKVIGIFCNKLRLIYRGKVTTQPIRL